MQCKTAKANPLVILQAANFYLNPKNKGKRFTFMSLYRDDEPYPIRELIKMLEAQLAEVKREHKERPNESLAITWRAIESRLSRLKASKP